MKIKWVTKLHFGKDPGEAPVITSQPLDGLHLRQRTARTEFLAWASSPRMGFSKVLKNNAAIGKFFSVLRKIGASRLFTSAGKASVTSHLPCWDSRALPSPCLDDWWQQLLIIKNLLAASALQTSHGSSKQLHEEGIIILTILQRRKLFVCDHRASKGWRQGKRKREWQEDVIIGWHHRLSEHGFEQTLGDSEGQGSLVCWSPWASQKVGHNWTTQQQQKGSTQAVWL